LLLFGLAANGQAEQVQFQWKAGKGAKVFLAGDFNNWNPTGNAMSDEDGDGVWTTTLDLPAGRYQYKFVVDGNWLTDDKASEFVDDGFGGKNSVKVVGDGGGDGKFVGAGGAAKAGTAAGGAAAGGATGGAASGATAPGSVAFELADQGYSQVFVAGEFNGWNQSGNAMQKDGNVWRTTIDLAAGSYPYKFVADGNWIADPAATETVDDGYGGKNSVKVVGGGGAAAPAAGGTASAPSAGAAAAGPPESVTFRYQPLISGIQSCHVVGSFNDWNQTSHPMNDDDGDGTWEATVELAPGEYRYKFLVDGNTWLEDPNAQDSADDGYGGSNSVIRVGPDTRTGAAQPRHVPFRFAPGGNPGEVSLAGTFNNWAIGKTPLSDEDGDGVWETTLLLPEGEYHYKFVVDGNWTTDDSAKWFVDDGFGGKNSGLTVDAAFEGIDLAVGDGRIFTDGIGHTQSSREVNPLSDDEVEFTTRAYNGDVESVSLVVVSADGSETIPLRVVGTDATFAYYRGTLRRAGAIDAGLTYAFDYQDGPTHLVLSAAGFTEAAAAQPVPLDEEHVVRFSTPDWVRDGVFYQIFPDRFANGDKSNDPDFSEDAFYKGMTTLPPSGKKNGEYFHLVQDWTDVAGLAKSPYRTDGLPDYFSFYGGDIAGVRQNLDYLQDLGVTILYFNPLFPARSNHKYEAADYAAIDPHFGTPEEFRAFVDECHSRGIRIVADWVINHIGDHSPYFQDTVKKGKDSEYWNWFEWHKWPLPAAAPADWREYYECWWGFSHMPDLNFDLSRSAGQEINVKDPEDAEINWPVVNYVLDSAEWWLKDMDVDGFRLDVPNEVPFWVWKLFRDRVRETKADAYLVGEIWSDAGDWVSPDCFDSVMNYKYFKDPVSSFIGQGRMDAAAFDRELQAGRMAYPMQAVRVMMNLVGSHDTVRYLTAINGREDRLKLTALFEMTYVGAPHIYYGDEIAMKGGPDPDCRRPFVWTWADDPDRKAMHDWYRDLIRLRRDHAAFTRGDYRTLRAEGSVHAFARTDGDEAYVVVVNAGDRPVDVEIPVDDVGASFEDALTGEAMAPAEGGRLPMKLAPISGVVLRRVSAS
jgi:glycosidase